MITRLRPALLALITFLAFLQPVLSSSNDPPRYITYESPAGETLYLNDNRRPALYTGNFGDCLGNSVINVTRFDAAYYKDNMTVLFHLAGNSALNNESLVMYIGVYAYGESRFDLLFNPCSANIASLCPVSDTIPITASGIIPVAPEDVSNIPPIALTIPDFEGQAILRIFANSTQSEIGCYSAVVTNGHSFAQPQSVGAVLGIFTLVAVIASFATAIYGEAVPTMRLHYAHSLSVGVVFAVFQHIFFTGALSMNWPSVLVAWWSNFAWSAGMIQSASMQRSIDRLIGSNVGNTSQVGAAPSDSTNNDLGGGYDISSIYKRMLTSGMKTPANHPFMRDLASDIYPRDPLKMFSRDVALQARDVLANKSDGYAWYGHPIGPGMPLPGNYSGFAGTLAEEGIPVSNAFMTAFLWFLILLVILVAAVVAFKWTLEGLARYKRISEDRFKFFRDHWLGYTTIVVLRAWYIAFFMMMFLTIFEFTFQSSAGVKAVAAIVFFVFLGGVGGIAAYACYYKKSRMGNVSNVESDQVQRKKLLGIFPRKAARNETAPAHDEPRQESATKKGKGLFKRKASTTNSSNNASIDNIHDNEDYTMKFGWLASRFRRTRWWFFTVWLFYEFVRAIFYAGASGFPMVQVFGLLVIEFVAFAYIIWMRPFEGKRLNIIVIYCLGFSKVASVALSAAFNVQFNLPRITTTAIGIVIVVIQGILTIITMIAIIVGAISSYMSVSRNREDFRPRKWHGLREKYFDHLDRVANDIPREPKPKRVKNKNKAAEETKEGFEVTGMRRLEKIEDQDDDFVSEMRQPDHRKSYLSLNNGAPSPVDAGERSGTATPGKLSRPGSVRSQTSLPYGGLPYGARAHRPSWSTRDLSAVGADESDRISPPIDMNKTVDDDEPVPAVSTKGHRRRSSLQSNRRSKQGVVYPTASTDSLRIGGETSTRDTIGHVPAPTTRARSNTGGSGSPDFLSGEPSDAINSLPDTHYRTSRYQPLTPAQEREEWGVNLTPKQSREH